MPETWDSPEGWVETLRAGGFRTAYWPLPDDAGDDAVDAYAAAADAAGISIAEIGVWNNPMDPDEGARRRAVAYAKERLALAERVGARCCVNIAGSRSAESWMGPHPDDLGADHFAAVVDTTREIIDAVKPRRTYYTLEPLPWALPDSPDSYLALLEAIDRPRMAVHLDPANLINTPAKYFGHAAFLRECFAKLGPHTKSVHARDLVLTSELSVHLKEARPGLGRLDYRVFLTEMDRLPADTPILVEHLTEASEYAAAVAHIRSVAGELGLET